MKNEKQDLIIIGGGIMGLMTAYYASSFVRKITIIEKNTISNKNTEAASFSFTRSIRTDYLEPLYAQLAYEAQLLWLDLEKKSSKDFFIKCGCLNIAKKSITPNLSQTYAEKSYQIGKALNFQPEKFSSKEMKKVFPQFSADLGRLDTKAGFLYLPVITELLLKLLKEKKVTIIENSNIKLIENKGNKVFILTNSQTFITKKLVITAGKGTNDVLKNIKSNKLILPITYDRPQRKYFYPPKEKVEMFLPEKLPVFAYTDVGMYGHPIFDKKKGAVKIAYFVPVGMKKDIQKITSIQDFIDECMPILKSVPSEEITDADNCWYDTVIDDDFILGKLPKFDSIFVGIGWRGTGYKFAPLIGKILSQLSLQNNTPYKIEKFSPERFYYETK